MNPKMHHQHTATGGGASNATATDTASVKLVDITPARARELLSRNVGNRQINHERVAMYKRDILAGNWAPNTSLIVIGTDGNLCNGQHTLTAIAEAGITTRCVLLVNPDLSAAQDWRGDRGNTRRADFVHRTSKDAWAVCRMIAEHVIARRPSDGEISTLIEPVSEILAQFSATQSRGRSSTAVRVAVATLAKLNPSKAAELALLYTAFVNNTFSGLTGSTHALGVALTEGRLRTNCEQDRNELMVRAYMAFDPARNGRAVVIRDYDARLAEVRAALRAAWLPGR